MTTTSILVSIIVTTKNNEETLEACLQSIKEQSYKPIELILVDNYSTDKTIEIAKKYTSNIYKLGPERSTQRNYGAKCSRGDYLCFIDSDMELTTEVIESCINIASSNHNLKAIIIPEESFGIGFWARCRRLERSFYTGIDSIEAARFFDKSTFTNLNGYNEKLFAGEDWELSRRMSTISEFDRIDKFIKHNEGHLKLVEALRKKYYYSQSAVAFFSVYRNKSALTDKSGPLYRYKLFFSEPGKLFMDPVLGLGMLLLKSLEYTSGGLGYLSAKLRYKDTYPEGVKS